MAGWLGLASPLKYARDRGLRLVPPGSCHCRNRETNHDCGVKPAVITWKLVGQHSCDLPLLFRQLYRLRSFS